MNPPLAPTANPLLSLPLIGAKAVEGSSQQTEPTDVLRLTRLLAAGDEEAYREFHQRYFLRLYQFLLVVAHGQEQPARDALQETLLRVVRYARPFESEEVFWSWLKLLARSAARDAGRKQQRYSRLLERFALGLRFHTAESSNCEADVLTAALEESLAELPQKDRDLIRAKYMAGSTIKELSREAGVTDKSIESRLHRLRRDLQERILRKLRSL